MPFTEDLQDFINPDTPGYVLADFSGNEIGAIFVNEAAPAPLGMAGFSSQLPLLYCQDSDVSAVDRGDQVIINSITYRVEEFDPDGTGITVLGLKK